MTVCEQLSPLGPFQTHLARSLGNWIGFVGGLSFAQSWDRVGDLVHSLSFAPGRGSFQWVGWGLALH